MLAHVHSNFLPEKCQRGRSEQFLFHTTDDCYFASGEILQSFSDSTMARAKHPGTWSVSPRPETGNYLKCEVFDRPRECGDPTRDLPTLAVALPPSPLWPCALGVWDWMRRLHMASQLVFLQRTWPVIGGVFIDYRPFVEAAASFP